MFKMSQFLIVFLLLTNTARADYFIENINWSEKFDNFSMSKKFKNAEITPIIRDNEIVANYFIVKDLSYDIYKNSTLTIFFNKNKEFDRVQINTYKKPYKTEAEDVYFEFYEANVVYADIFNKLINQYGRNKFTSLEIAKEGTPVWEINSKTLISIGIACADNINKCSVWIEYLKNSPSTVKLKTNSLKDQLKVKL